MSEKLTLSFGGKPLGGEGTHFSFEVKPEPQIPPGLAEVKPKPKRITPETITMDEYTRYLFAREWAHVERPEGYGPGELWLPLTPQQARLCADMKDLSIRLKDALKAGNVELANALDQVRDYKQNEISTSCREDIKAFKKKHNVGTARLFTWDNIIPPEPKSLVPPKIETPAPSAPIIHPVPSMDIDLSERESCTPDDTTKGVLAVCIFVLSGLLLFTVLYYEYRS